METLQYLRKRDLYRETRAALEHYQTQADQDEHLFDAWSMLLALEDHIASVVLDSHTECLLAKDISGKRKAQAIKKDH